LQEALLKPKITITPGAKGVTISIDSFGRIPNNVVLANGGTGLAELFSRDYTIGDEDFDERWHVGGDEPTAFALLTEGVRRALDKAGKRCVIRVNDSVLEATTKERELNATSVLVKELAALVKKLALTQSGVRRRLEGWADSHPERKVQLRAEKLLQRILVAP